MPNGKFEVEIISTQVFEQKVSVPIEMVYRFCQVHDIQIEEMRQRFVATRDTSVMEAELGASVYRSLGIRLAHHMEGAGPYMVQVLNWNVGALRPVCGMVDISRTVVVHKVMLLGDGVDEYVN